VSLKKECAHVFDAIVPAPSTLQQISPYTEGRDALSADWDGVSYNNFGKESGKFFMCNNCAAAGCKVCVGKSTAGDFSEHWEDVTGWCCSFCQA
jgi:hypothetical protein